MHTTMQPFFQRTILAHYSSSSSSSIFLSLPPLAPAAMATGTAEVIVTVGGEDDKVVLRSVESFDPVSNQWRNLACLPFAVSKHGLVVSGKGRGDGGEVQHVWMASLSNAFLLCRLHSVPGGRRVPRRLGQQGDVALRPLLRLLDRDGAHECSSLRVR